MKDFLFSVLWRLSLAAAVGIGIISLFVFVVHFLRNSVETEVFSLRMSPDRAFVAESVLVGNGEGGGRLVVRTKDGSERSIDLGEPAPDLFLRWMNDKTLELWSERQPIDLHGTKNLGDVRLVAKSYAVPAGITYDRPGARTITVPAGDVIATFLQRDAKNRSCILMLGAAHDPSHDAANVEIIANVNPSCARPRPCLGIFTRFTIEGGRNEDRQSALTSATVSNIPSYNRLPTGDQGTSVRGQFLESSAESLMREIAKPSVELDFSRDFFEQVVDYRLPLSRVAVPIAEFRQCVGEAEPLR